MGMYTEFHFYAELEKEIPQEVVEILKYMAAPGMDEYRVQLPDHPFFTCSRWRYLFTMGSAYFPCRTSSENVFFKDYGHWFLNINSNLKNYSFEIQLFLDWIAPYLRERDGCLGYYRYEEG